MPGPGERQDKRRGGRGDADPGGNRLGDPPRVPLLPLVRQRLVTILPGAGPPASRRTSTERTWRGTIRSFPVPLRIRSAPLGVALDLGTSTLAATLVGSLGRNRPVRATADNPQVACGEDLISRVVFAEETTGGFELLRSRLLSGWTAWCGDSSKPPRCRGKSQTSSPRETPSSPTSCTGSPLSDPAGAVPSGAEGVSRRAGGGLGDRPGDSAAVWRIFPSLGGFVGGDVVADILASGMHRQEEVSLPLRRRTNGEVALGNRDWRIACSSSAGPAFEGARSAAACARTRGRSRPSGSIRRHRRRRGRRSGGGDRQDCAGREFSTVRRAVPDRDRRPVGTVHFPRRRRAPLHGARRSVRRRPGEKSATGHDVVFCESDLKSILRTKAALCAAAESLLAAVGLPLEAVARVYVAGGSATFSTCAPLLPSGCSPHPPRPFAPLETRRWPALSARCATGGAGKRRFRSPPDDVHDLSSDPGFHGAVPARPLPPPHDEESYRSVLAAEGRA